MSLDSQFAFEQTELPKSADRELSRAEEERKYTVAVTRPVTSISTRCRLFVYMFRITDPDIRNA